MFQYRFVDATNLDNNKHSPIENNPGVHKTSSTLNLSFSTVLIILRLCFDTWDKVCVKLKSSSPFVNTSRNLWCVNKNHNKSRSEYKHPWKVYRMAIYCLTYVTFNMSGLSQCLPSSFCLWYTMNQCCVKHAFFFLLTRKIRFLSIQFVSFVRKEVKQQF